MDDMYVVVGYLVWVEIVVSKWGSRQWLVKIWLNWL